MMKPDVFDNFEDDLSIDLTPMIDCLFMLIIFFVLTMSFSRPVLEVVLPEAKNAEVTRARDEIMVGVKADGSYWVNEESLTLEEIAVLLDSQPEKILNIYMDAKAPFSNFVKVLDIAKVKRAGRFVISTDPVKDAPAAPHKED